MMAHGCKVMVRGRVWEEDVPPPVQSMKPKLLQSSKVHGGLQCSSQKNVIEWGGAEAMKWPI